MTERSTLGGTGPLELISIGELAARSGTTVAVIRSWEDRHGFPRPLRLAGGHRRYGQHDASVVSEVVRLRGEGLSVAAAIATATVSIGGVPSDSFFASLRSKHPELRPQVLTKSVLLALTTAIEDECCARAARPVLYGAFQRVGYYRQAQRRWEALARTAATAVVFADFDQVSVRRGRPAEVPYAADAAVGREWALVCDAPGCAACLAGWELPGPVGLADGDRRFETVWSLDPGTVRDAARVGADLAGDSVPTSLPDPPSRPAVASADLRAATAMFARLLSYVQEDTTRRRRWGSDTVVPGWFEEVGELEEVEHDGQ